MEIEQIAWEIRPIIFQIEHKLGALDVPELASEVGKVLHEATTVGPLSAFLRQCPEQAWVLTPKDQSKATSQLEGLVRFATGAAMYPDIRQKLMREIAGFHWRFGDAFSEFVRDNVMFEVARCQDVIEVRLEWAEKQIDRMSFDFGEGSDLVALDQ